jgi:RimJ/RimL family protein N-acetyltransferase
MSEINQSKPRGISYVQLSAANLPYAEYTALFHLFRSNSWRIQGLDGILMSPDFEISFSKMQLEELEWFLGIRNQVRHKLHNTEEFNLAQCKVWYSTTPILYFVVHAEIDSKVVKCGYFRVRYLDTIGIAEIGMDLDPEFQGRNIAYAAYRKFARFIRESHDINGLTLRVRVENTRAIRLYERLGFENLGTYTTEGFSEYLMFSSVTNLVNLPT